MLLAFVNGCCCFGPGPGVQRGLVREISLKKNFGSTTTKQQYVVPLFALPVEVFHKKNARSSRRPFLLLNSNTILEPSSIARPGSAPSPCWQIYGNRSNFLENHNAPGGLPVLCCVPPGCPSPGD